MAWTKDIHTTSYKTWHGFDKKQWENLLGKGASLSTLRDTNLKGEVPEYREIQEGREKFKHKRHFWTGWIGPFQIKTHTGTTNYWRGTGKKRSGAEGVFAPFETREEGQREVDRVLGIFAKRRSEAAMKTRAPGRRATMLTTGY